MGFFSRSKKETVPSNIALAVIDGTVKTLSSLKDGVFSEKMMGDGIVVAPAKDAQTVDFFAPVSGELVTVFPTGHAYGIKTKDGVEVLLHIGVDTVNLDGKGFTPAVKQGQKVSAGDKLVSVDVEFVRKNAPSSDAIVIVTSGQAVTPIVAKGDIEARAQLLTINL